MHKTSKIKTTVDTLSVSVNSDFSAEKKNKHDTDKYGGDRHRTMAEHVTNCKNVRLLGWCMPHFKCDSAIVCQNRNESLSTGACNVCCVNTIFIVLPFLVFKKMKVDSN